MNRTPRSMAQDLLEGLVAARERSQAAALLRARIEVRDETARALADQLGRAPLARHVRALAESFGIPDAFLRDALALEVARCRVRELAARVAVTGGSK